jgi:uncharacterized protein (TIGR03643 family)
MYWIDRSMGLSKTLKLKIDNLDIKDKEKLVKMTIEDKTSFSDIKRLFDLTPGEVEKFLLKELGEQRFKRWKLRQQRRSTNKGRPVVDLD